MKFDLYIVAPLPGPSITLDFTKDLPSQLFPFEQEPELFRLLPDIRLVSITAAFVVLVSPLGPPTENSTRLLEKLKAEGVIDFYRLVTR